MELEYDPLSVFRKSRTPWGLYARKRWLGQAGDPVFQADFNRTVGELLADRTSDGLWGHSALTTIHRLFGLHLTRREADPVIDRALDRLMEIAREIFVENRTTHVDELDPVALEGLPFTQSRSDVFITSAALFLGTIFGRAAADDKGPITMFLTALALMDEMLAEQHYNYKVVLDPEEEARQVEPPPRGGRRQPILHLREDLLRQGVQPRRGEKVSQLVQRDGDVEADVHEHRRDQRLPAGEDETEHLQPQDLGVRQGEHRGDEGDVEGDQDVVGDHPTLLETRHAATGGPPPAGSPTVL